MTPYPSISELLPHTGSMVLLDQVLSATEETITCCLTVGDGFCFIEDGRVQPWICLEYMAQAAAAFDGLNPNRHGKATVGFLVTCRNLSIACDHLAFGEKLVVEVRCLENDPELKSFSGQIRSGEKVICTGEFKIHIPPIGEQSS